MQELVNPLEIHYDANNLIKGTGYLKAILWSFTQKLECCQKSSKLKICPLQSFQEHLASLCMGNIVNIMVRAGRDSGKYQELNTPRAVNYNDDKRARSVWRGLVWFGLAWCAGTHTKLHTSWKIYERSIKSLLFCGQPPSTWNMNRISTESSKLHSQPAS